MEAHGFMEACHQKEVPACVLKGISDLGDTGKATLEEQSGGFFRAYACSNAVLALLSLFLASFSGSHGGPPSMCQLLNLLHYTMPKHHVK